MPHFEVKDQDGNIVNSEELIGRKTIIYFYPKDNTSGCTAEACNLRDNYEALVAKGYNVIGVSKDSVKSHKNFEEKYSLPFTLLSDPEHKVLEMYGAWGEKKNYGKVSMGTIRTTYLIDEEGTIIKAMGKVKAADNPAQMLEALS